MFFAILFLLTLHPLIAYSDGAIGFHIELEVSGSNFRSFYEQLNASLRANGLERYLASPDNIFYIENAFTLTAEGEQRIPEIMGELRDSLCFFSKRIFATTGATRWMFPEFTEISVAVDGRAVHDTIANVLALNGLSSYPAEYDRKASRHFCPRRIILARLPRDAPAVPSVTAGKVRSEVKVKAKVGLFKCSSSWQEGDCFPIQWIELDTPCRKECDYEDMKNSTMFDLL